MHFFSTNNTREVKKGVHVFLIMLNIVNTVVFGVCWKTSIAFIIYDVAEVLFISHKFLPFVHISVSLTRHNKTISSGFHRLHSKSFISLNKFDRSWILYGISERILSHSDYVKCDQKNNALISEIKSSINIRCVIQSNQ